MKLYPTRTDDEHARITADYMLNGAVMVAKRVQSTNTYKFLKGVSKEFGRFESTVNDFARGWNITKSALFLEEWEGIQGIPDGSFSAVGTIENRRKHAHAKLAAEGLQTKDDIEWLMSLLGWYSIAWPGHYFYNNPDPRVPTFSSEKESRFTLVIETYNALSEPGVIPALFPMPFPWVFGINEYNIAQKFMRTIIPANVQLIWILDSENVTTGYGYFPYGISAYGL